MAASATFVLVTALLSTNGGIDLPPEECDETKEYCCPAPVVGDFRIVVDLGDWNDCISDSPPHPIDLPHLRG